MRSPELAVAALCAAALAACGGRDEAKAIETVRSYNERLARAYRTADIEPLRPIAGAEEVRKVAALIGVKLDQGIAMDAQLLELEVVGVRRLDQGLEVRTKERWYYEDRQIGTGARVGDDSTDRYEMAYTVREESGRWVVAAVAFATEPLVGRPEVNQAPSSVMHGVETRNPGQERVRIAPRPQQGGAKEAP